MKKSKVLAYRQLPSRLPFGSTATAALLLDRLSAPSWVWGMVGTLYAILWIVCIVGICTEETVELKELQ